MSSETSPNPVGDSLDHSVTVAGRQNPISPEDSRAAAAPPTAMPPKSSRRRWTLLALIHIVGITGLYFAIPMAREMLSTVSTDDAYVNSHVTFVAARVPGQVAKVFVDDNNRVAKGDLIVQLDKEPYQIMVNVKQAAVESAEADLLSAQVQIRGMAAQARSFRFKLEHAVEDVNNQVALLRANVATLEAKQATLQRATADLERAQKLYNSKTISREEFDRANEAAQVAAADAKQAKEQVMKIRVLLGLPAVPIDSDDLAQVPPDLQDNFSTIRQTTAEMIQAIAPLGVFPTSLKMNPKEVTAEFLGRDPEGDINRIYEKLMSEAPLIKQATAKLQQARRDLDQAELNLRYCDVYAEIDGVVTRRNVNPGNNIQAGQSLMAVRSLTEVWVDANFKETQLRNLRIGQRVELRVDMYGSRKIFEGRITGFTMGTGTTLSLLPAQNATGNFIKVVQRLPVRIEPIDYDPETDPLFVGLSVEPHVFIYEQPKGPDAGKFLQRPQLTAAAPVKDRKQP